MSASDQAPPGEHHHNYLRLLFLIGTVLLFNGYIVIDQMSQQGNNRLFPNATQYVEDLFPSDIKPSDWIYRSLTVFNYFWQLAWLFYALTFICRRSTNGYLYLSPKTLTPMFCFIYVIGFLIQTIWLIFFYQDYIIWSWILYLVSFLLLSLALFIINNNVTVNKKIYQTEGLSHDIWCLRFFVQNGIAFFACWTAIRFILAFNAFLQVKLALSTINSGTISLGLAAIIACGFFFGPNLNAILVERCAYEFSPWLVFVIFFSGVVENNWIPTYPTRNNIISAIELLACVVSAIIALAVFTIRYRASKSDPVL